LGDAERGVRAARGELLREPVRVQAVFRAGRALVGLVAAMNAGTVDPRDASFCHCATPNWAVWPPTGELICSKCALPPKPANP
jgi:hypothetical protein